MYADAVESAGGTAVRASLNEPQSVLAKIANSCAGILLPGSPADVDPEKYGERRISECGPKDGAREAADDLFLQDAFNLYKPILAICYGLQSLNVWCNGTLIQHLPGRSQEDPDKIGASISLAPPVDHHPGGKVVDAHSVALVPGSRLATILAGICHLDEETGILQLTVNSSHHQAIDKLGDQLAIVARSREDEVIEAVEGTNPQQFVLGIQWHPEKTFKMNDASQSIFEAFVTAARRWHPRVIRESVQGNPRS